MNKKIPPLRENQESVVKQLYQKINFEQQGEETETRFIGLQAGTGYGKTRSVLEALRTSIESFRHTTEGNPLLSKLKPKTQKERVFVFIRTKSQVQSFLRECETLGLSAIAIPSKSSVCYNNMMSDTAEDLKNLFNKKPDKTNSLEAELNEDEIDDDVNFEIDKEIWKIDPLLKPVLKFVKGKCSDCPLNPLMKADDRHPGMQTLMKYFNKAQPKSGSVDDIMKKFMSCLKEKKNLEKAINDFLHEYPYVCPYSLVMFAIDEVNPDIIILTYPYLVSTSIRDAMKHALFKEGINTIVMDECHNLATLVSGSCESSLTKDKLERIGHKLTEAIGIRENIKNPKKKNAKTQEANKYILEKFFGETGVFEKVHKVIVEWCNNWEAFTRGVSQDNLHFEPSHFKKIFTDGKQDINDVKDFCEGAVNRFNKMISGKTKVGLTGNMKRLIQTITNTIEVFQVILRVFNFYNSDTKEEQVYYFKDDNSISIQPIIYREKAKEIFGGIQNVIMLSGTMPTLEYWDRMFGIQLDNVKVDRKVGNMELIAVSGLDSKWTNRNDSVYRGYAEIIEEIHKDSKKNTLVGFTSNSFMDKVWDYVSPETNKWKPTKDSTVNDIIREMTMTAQLSPGVYGIVAGSKFSEGVEYVKNGESLIDRVIICGIPIPPPTLPNEDLKNYLIKELGIPNWDAYSQTSNEPAYQKIRQLIGRAIRGPKDSCKIYLVDTRFTEQTYWKKSFDYDDTLEWEI